jgi:nucleoside-diphosphate-sugar epimerase
MILITGINGFIANNLLNKLKSNPDIEVYGTTKQDSSKIIEILNEKKPEYIYHTGAEIYNNDFMFVIISIYLPKIKKVEANYVKGPGLNKTKSL